MDSPLISVVTICRDDLKGLQRTYNSLNIQTHSDSFEWIVIDGYSSDGTKVWLEKYHTFPGSWLSEPDNGIYNAMQKGALRATGDYVIFLNSGDTFAGSGVLGQVLSWLVQEKVGLLYGDAWDVSPDSKKKNFRPARNPEHLKFGMPTHHQAMFFRRDLLVGCDFESFRLSGDYAMACWVKSRDEKIVYLPVTVCNFLTGGLHDIHRLEAIREDYKIRRKYLGMSVTSAGFLRLLHLLHFELKRKFPVLMTALRSWST